MAIEGQWEREGERRREIMEEWEWTS